MNECDILRGSKHTLTLPTYFRGGGQNLPTPGSTPLALILGYTFGTRISRTTEHLDNWEDAKMEYMADRWVYGLLCVVLRLATGVLKQWLLTPINGRRKQRQTVCTPCFIKKPSTRYLIAHNFSKYWPIFKTLSLAGRIGSKHVMKESLNVPLHFIFFATLTCEI